MQQVIPNMVNTVMHIESNKDLLGINTTDGMVPYLVKAIQELTALVTAQQAQINALLNK